ncbi:alpha/beta fold hydrolase [Sulfitobacter sediminilitoris]|nr:alpha/beta fold hydrolase [Sulfitobacter sediminilitoris]
MTASDVSEADKPDFKGLECIQFRGGLVATVLLSSFFSDEKDHSLLSLRCEAETWRSKMERRLAAVLVADMVGYSRLIERDEINTLNRQKQHRRELIDPEIERNRGRIVKTTGDGMIAEFASARDAARCAIDIQIGMAGREESHDADNRIQYRVGINIGDVIFDGDDMFGDGVNVAARLESLAEPGGVCISDIVHQTISDGLNETFRDLGSQRIKNISRPIRVWQWAMNQPKQLESPVLSQGQKVRFCSSEDGTQIAWARVGEGAPVLRAPHWMSHLEYEWNNPLFGPFINRFAKATAYHRFDQRGNGLSDRHITNISIAAIRQDMEAVVAAAGLDRFALFAASQGAGFAVDYAARYPEKVTCIVFLGGYLRGSLARKCPEQEKFYNLSRQMIEDGWGSPNPIYRHFFTSGFAPDCDAGTLSMFDELQRVATDTGDALRLFDMLSNFDFKDQAEGLRVPTLVLHARGDRRAPVEEGRLIARTIPGAEFIELPGNNHMLTEGMPDFDQFFEHALPFIRAHTLQQS